MFHESPAGEGSASLRIAIGVLIAIVIATAMNVWLVIEVRKEQRAIAEIVRGGVAEDIQRLGSLPGELRWQFVLSLLVLLVLIAAAVTITFAMRAYTKSQASLRKVKMLAWDILSCMDQAVITTDPKGRITSLNPRVEDLLGIHMRLVGKPLADVCDIGPVLVDLAKQVLQSRKPAHERDLHVEHSGHRLHLRVDCHVLWDATHDVSGTVLHIRDVTDRTLMEAQMKRMERFMGLGALAAGLHHEIKNPLGALALHIQLLEERLADNIDSETAENIGVVKSEVTRISGVLESFRDYASLDTLNRTDVDARKLVGQTAELIRPKAEQQGVSVELIDNNLCLPTISADATRVEQVLLNLVVNALDQMTRGGTLTLAVDSDSESVVIHVADTGPGIPDRIRSRIFDPFFTTRNTGMGMGLAVCDKIIQQHGGRIDVDTSSHGTTFHVSVPLEPTEDLSLGDLSPEPATAVPLDARVLVNND
jgi:PAS domain S-box-containing protein